MITVKAFVRVGDAATIICPSCNAAKHVKVGAYKHKKHNFKVRCQCLAIFGVQLEFRSHYRKPTDLTGTYMVTNPPGSGGGVIHIKNISRGGIGFSVSGMHHMVKDQSLIVEFNLNDRQYSKVRKEAVIRMVNGNAIGCQFLDNQPFEKALGFYLQQ